MARVLITGASGLLGSNLASDWADRHEVVGTYHRNFVELDGVEMLQVDLTRPGAVRELVETCPPDWIINCAAATDLDRCEQEPEWADALNHRLAGEIGEIANRFNSRLVHISTDAVFDGLEGPYKEGDPPNPVSVYGRTKLAGERAVLESSQHALALRTNLFGIGLYPGRSLAEWFISNLEQGMPCPGFTDVHFSPILVNHFGEFIKQLINADANGLLHVGGKTCLTKYEFGVLLAKELGTSPEMVRPTSIDTAGLQAPRAKRLCLDSSMAEELLGVMLPEVRSGIAKMMAIRKEETH